MEENPPLLKRSEGLKKKRKLIRILNLAQHLLI